VKVVENQNIPLIVKTGNTMKIGGKDMDVDKENKKVKTVSWIMGLLMTLFIIIFALATKLDYKIAQDLFVINMAVLLPPIILMAMWCGNKMSDINIYLLKNKK
jgi:hypothetical protein